MYLYGAIYWKKAKIRNTYNQIPHLTQDTKWESDKNTRNITYKRAKRLALSQHVISRLQHVNIRLTTPVLMDVALLSISQWLVSENAHKSSTTWYIWIKLHTCEFKHCPAVGMQNHDEAAGRIENVKSTENHNIYFKLKDMQ